MAVCRANHYVPQFYLRNWGTDNKVFVHRLLVPHEKYPEWEHCAIKNTAYIDNLYVRIEDGAEYDDFEIDFNKQVETPAKPVLDKICAEQKLTPADWRILCDYITAQYVRTPSFYNWAAEWGKKTVPDAIESVLNAIARSAKKPDPRPHSSEKNNLIPVELNLSKREEDEDHTYLEVRSVVGKNLWLYVISHTLSSDSVLKREFQSMKWSIVTAPDGVVWPTCDAPIVIARIEQSGNLICTDGLGNKDRIVIFPVSPTKVLLATHKRVFTWRFQADEALYRRIKAIIVKNAFMYVYSCFEDPEIPTIRSRFVNEAEFVRLKREYASWYDKYKTDEAPMLTKERNIVKYFQEQ